MERLNIEDITEWPEITNVIDLFKGGELIGQLVPNEPIRIESVEEIINRATDFLVPAYQRGYRWEKKQVDDLLNDIWSWGLNSETKGKYSLQPIVLKKSDDESFDYDLVDGQQRLTTIYLIIKAAGKNPNFTLNYETRDGSADFLRNISQNANGVSENIDYFYFTQTYKMALDFFEQSDHDSERWLQYLNEAFFIVYNATQAGDKRSSESVFTGLNAGKIPLTASELVKGLFLRKSNFDDLKMQNEIIEISTEWDRIEKRLRDKNFWSWLGQKETDAPRIDFVLSVVAGNKDFYAYFNNELANGGDDVKSLWLEIKKCFMTFEDWYDDLRIYHLIGFINKYSDSIVDYYNHYIDDTLDLAVATGVQSLLEKFDDLSYENSKDVEKTLFLFNVLTCIETKNRFRFDSYILNKYDIEHISPHAGFDNLYINDRKLWLEEVKECGLYAEKNLDIDISDDAAFNDLYADLADNERLGDEEGVIDSIGNLCLLDATTNRSYGNKPFPIKAQTVMKVEADQQNKEYILPTTKNVFLKYYSGLNINNFTWDSKDADAYETAIKESLLAFAKGESNEHAI
ncbi:MAG: DUF262 domain-containing HNH endonuclease family protein [Lactobacillales bacterium]|jgi:hypothetical protein|nr:DUF262 domain-containing HNH endonuclease family protein [Lactobacillales bacterium]